MKTLGKAFGAASAAAVLLTNGFGSAHAMAQSDTWFYFKTVPANFVTWGGFDAESGGFLGEGVCGDDAVVPVAVVQVDRDPVTADLFVLGSEGVFTVDYTNARCEFSEIIVPAEFPIDLADEYVSLRGISLNVARTAVDVLWFDEFGGDYCVSEIDVSTGDIISTVELYSADLIMTDAQAMTRIGDIVYVASSDNHLWAFDVTTGDQMSRTDGPLGATVALGLDRSTDGKIHIATAMEGTENIGFSTFDPTTSSWSDLVDTTYPRTGYTYIESVPELASTGVNAAGFALVGAALVATGAIVALRRRARR